MRRLPLYPSASSLYRAAGCIAPEALGLPEAEDTSSEWAERGRKLHEAAERIATGKPRHEHFDAAGELALEHVTDAICTDQDAAKRLWWPGIGETRVLAEQGILWRPGFPDDEARLVQREPGQRVEGWFSGTADLVFVRADGVLVVVDWKFGIRTRLVGERAEDHAQLQMLALGFATALGITGSAAGVVVARIEVRYVDERGVHVDAADLTQGDLDAWRDELVQLADRLDKGIGAMPRENPACGSCRSKAYCPAWEAQGAALRAHYEQLYGAVLSRPPATAEEARALHYAAKRMEADLEQAREHVKAYALTHPEGVQIGLGLSLKACEVKRDGVVNTPEALALIRATCGEGAIERRESSTMELIKRAARAGAGNGITSKADRDKAKKAAEIDVLEALTAGGAIVMKGSSWQVMEVRDSKVPAKQASKDMENNGTE